MMIKHKRFLYTTCTTLIIIGIFAVTAWLIWREYSQQKLNKMLIVSIKENDPMHVKFLLAHGADPNARDLGNRSLSIWELFCIAIHRQSINALGRSALSLSLQQGKKGIYISPQYRSQQIPIALIDAGADINERDAKDGPMIVLATVNGYYQAVNHLITKGVNVNSVDGFGGTALMFAARSDEVALINTLLDKGANINAQSHDGETPLVFAVVGENVASVNVLVNHGVNVNQTDVNGNTPLDLAEDLLTSQDSAFKDSPGMKEIVSILKNHGAK